MKLTTTVPFYLGPIDVGCGVRVYPEHVSMSEYDSSYCLPLHVVFLLLLQLLSSIYASQNEEFMSISGSMIGHSCKLGQVRVAPLKEKVPPKQTLR
jgi:hypothetical protein